MRYFALIILAAAFLAGCRADITYRFVVNPNSTITVTSSETIDDQAYQLVTSQASPGTDPFGAQAATAAGWSVTRSVTEDGHHLIAMTKTFTRAQAADIGNVTTPHAGDKDLPLHWTHTQSRGFFTITENYKASMAPSCPRQRQRPTLRGLRSGPRPLPI